VLHDANAGNVRAVDQWLAFNPHSDPQPFAGLRGSLKVGAKPEFHADDRLAVLRRQRSMPVLSSTATGTGPSR
jgi:hypothetical protein